jgi:ferredoxin--NADP+ reductase
MSLTQTGPDEIEALREKEYNATISHVEFVHPELWILRVKADGDAPEHKPGQYASLALGYWEPRIDDAMEPEIGEKFTKLVRRSYSICCRVLDDDGNLVGSPHDGELEFYVVLVAPTDEWIPGLTPRLALKREGDRLFMGRKAAGRYTLDPVTDPTSAIVLLSTGTGEAPHNVMVTDLLRRGHQGPIVSAVTVRRNNDLAYLAPHRALEERFPNYHYLALPTREPDVPKRHLQDLISDGSLEAELGGALRPADTHVFLCGNPDMIGLPETGDDGADVYPERTGVVEMLVERGFKLDRRKDPGNIHYEEFW